MEDMEQLFAEAKKRGIRIMMDLVLNHTSDEHRWFLEAKKSKDNPYHDYYVWRDGEEGIYPNDMNSAFGGPAWEWVPELGQYYFQKLQVFLNQTSKIHILKIDKSTILLIYLFHKLN